MLIKELQLDEALRQDNKRYKVIYGRFGSIMTQPTFDELRAAVHVATVQDGCVVDTTTGEVVFDSNPKGAKGANKDDQSC